MSWIRLIGLLAFFTATVNAQTPQLASPQYGLPEQPRGYADNGPQPNLAPATASEDSREYLQLFNQPSAAKLAPVLNNPAVAPLNAAMQATFEQPVSAASTPLASRLNGELAPANNAPRTINPNGAKPLPLAGPNAKSPAAIGGWSNFGTMLGSLAVVLGLFVVTIKLLRRGLPASKQRLGREVVEVLGQSPLANRHSLQVIRFGNKILLVALSSEGCDTLTEITDPLEVDRLAGLCVQSQSHSSTTTFREMFSQVTSLRSAATSDKLVDNTVNTPALDEVRARLRSGSPATTREVLHG